MSSATESLTGRLESRTARVAVLGLGYAGWPMALALAKAGFSVTGLDVDPRKVGPVNSGVTPIADFADDGLASLVVDGRLRASTDFSVLEAADCVVICVPTPLTLQRTPDLRFVAAAGHSIAEHLHHGMLVVLQSTCDPGATRRVLLPIFAATGLAVGQDYFLAFASERVDPGNRCHGIPDVPKVVGGVTPRCTDVAARLFAAVVERVVTVSSPEVAELSKLVENTFRFLNIGLINSVAILCDQLGVDVWEVVDAAATKPFGFMPHQPGPGVGGECIPVVPYFLKAASADGSLLGELVDLAGRINARMPEFVVEKLGRLLDERGRPLAGSRVLVLGAAYKSNLSDARGSPAVPILDQLREAGADVAYFDPRVPRLACRGMTLATLDEASLVREQFDCAVLVTRHDGVAYADIARRVPFVLDTRNAIVGIEGATIVRL